MPALRMRHTRLMTATGAAVVAVLLALTAWLTLVVLTARGERRRSRRWSVAILAGLFFPVTWVVWYLRDEHHYRARLTAR